MLTYLTILITAYLALEILRAPCGADAIGYVLVSGLIPLPLYIIGDTAEAAVFAIDVCLLAYILGQGNTALRHVLEHRALSAGIGVLIGFSTLVTCSGIFNFIFVDPSALKFYAFTIVKFWEYVLLAIVVIASKPSGVQLRKLCTIVLTGILLYEILHTLHISGIVPLSGEAYLGPNAIPIQAVAFTDRTGWFLTSYRGVISGTASVSACFSIMIFEAYSGKLKILAGATTILSLFSVFATTDRSDIVGLAVAAVVFAMCAPPRRWGVYACAMVAAAGLYLTAVTLFLPPSDQAIATARMSELWTPELRAEGSYAERSSDRTSLLRYLPEHPRTLLIGVGPGNFHWYQTHRITINFFGHNSYLHWTGELGIGGLLLLLAWCTSVCLFAAKRLRSENPICEVAGRACLAMVIGRMAAAWGGEYLFGVEGMLPYSMYFVGVVYLLVSIASDNGVRGWRFPGSARKAVQERQPKRLVTVND